MGYGVSKELTEVRVLRVPRGQSTTEQVHYLRTNARVSEAWVQFAGYLPSQCPQLGKLRLGEPQCPA